MPGSVSSEALARRAVVQGGAPAPTGTGTTLAHHAATLHATTGAQTVSASSLLVQMVVGLIVVVVLIKLASRFVRGRGGRSLGLSARSRTQAVSVLGRQSLGKGVQVAMVAAGHQTFLLGVTARQVTLLGEIGPGGAETTAAGLASDPGTVPGALQLVSGGNGSEAAAEGAVPGWKAAIEQIRVRTVRRA